MVKISTLATETVDETVKGLRAYIMVTDEDGGVVVRKPANSLLRGFYDTLYAHMANVNTSTIAEDGTSITIDPVRPGYFNFVSAPGETRQGIVVGTGTTPVSMTDFRLAAKIGHGTGAGQLIYGSTSVTSLEYLGINTFRFYVTRLFTNNSGSDITVNEVGLLEFIPTWSRGHLVDRTLVTFVVPNGRSRNVVYELRVTV
ncbi:MAG: hypothetical protein QXP81_09825 [Nitrososphaerota archaeon]